MNTSDAPVNDPRTFRDTLGHYASGITVISATVNGEPVGFTCQSFFSVSITPPLIAFSVQLTSTSYPRIREAGTCVVNVLASDQSWISNQFARSGTDKWQGIESANSLLGNPVILGTQMWLECEIVQEYEAGDHLIIIGKVFSMSPAEWHQAEPLVYFRGAYHHVKAAS